MVAAGVGVEPSIPVEQLSVVSARGIPDLSMDLVYVNGLTEHVDLRWDHPLMARFLERLASFSPAHQVRSPRRRRLHPVPLDALPTWEEWAEDLRAVLDAVGSERAAIYAELDAGPVEMIFAATHPERTSALVLGNTMARYSMAGDPAFLRWRAEFTRASATPRTVAAQYRYIFRMDVRSVRATITVPTLVLHRSSFSLVPVEHGRYLAEHIPGARFVEVAEQASRLGDRSWRTLLDAHYAILRAELGRFGSVAARSGCSMPRRRAEDLHAELRYDLSSQACLGWRRRQRWRSATLGSSRWWGRPACKVGR